MQTPKTPTRAIAAEAAHGIGSDGATPRTGFDVAVVMPTILRPEMARAARSVFAQVGAGRIHLLIGVDKAIGDRAILESIRAEVPEGVLLTVVDPGYSTSQRHGGLYPAHDGGALRTILSYLANARYIAYLDDDNWWAPDHLASLLGVIGGQDWAFSLRWFVEPESGKPLGIDRIESVGPDRGGYARTFGGWVDPNCLMLDVTVCEPVLRLWCRPLFGDPSRMSADRRVFKALRDNFQAGETTRATSFYTLDPKDPAHETRMAWLADKERGIQDS